MPRSVLLPRCQPNEIILLEQERPDCLKEKKGTCRVELVDRHVIDGPTPQGKENYMMRIGSRGSIFLNEENS